MTTLQELVNNKYPSDRGNVTDVGIVREITAQGILDLKEYTSLTFLNLGNNNLNNEQFLAILKSIPNKEKMTKLYFYDNLITDPNFDYVGANFPNLELIGFTDSPLDKNISVKGLSKCPKLKQIHLGKAEEPTIFRDMDFLPTSIIYYNSKDADYLNDLKKKSAERRIKESQAGTGKVKLEKDIKVKPLLKDIPESNYDKIIFVDDKKLNQQSWLFYDILSQTLFNNPKFVVPMEGHLEKEQMIRVASAEALSDLKRVFPNRLFRANLPLTQLTNYGGESTYKIYFVSSLTCEPRANFALTNLRGSDFDRMQLDSNLFTFIKSDDGSGLKRAKIKNLEAFKFLQKYAGDYAFEVVYPKGESFNINELPQSVLDVLPPLNGEGNGHGSDDSALDKFNQKWKELMSKDFTPTSWENLKKRYDEGKNAILTDPYFTSFKTKTPKEQKEMWKSIQKMYADSAMLYAENSMKNEGSKPFITSMLYTYYEYKNTFLNMVDVDKWLSGGNPDEITSLTNENNKLKAELNIIKQQVQDYESGLKDKLGLNDSNLSTWKDEIDKLKQLQTQVDDLKKQVETQKNFITAQNDNIVSLTSKLGKKDKVISGQEAEIKILKAKIVGLQQTIKDSMEKQTQALQLDPGKQN